MSNLKQSFSEIGEGWVVNVYGSDRRLLCTLDPSHGWVLMIGMILGGLLMLGGVGGDRPQTESPSTSVPKTAPLSVD